MVTGQVRGAAIDQVQIVVALEPVVSDDAVGELLDLYAAEVPTDADGHFVHRYVVPEAVRRRLHGWVMCAVTVQTRNSVAPTTKVVRWQRPSAGPLIAALSALLGTIVIDIPVLGSGQLVGDEGQDPFRSAITQQGSGQGDGPSAPIGSRDEQDGAVDGDARAQREARRQFP